MFVDRFLLFVSVIVTVYATVQLEGACSNNTDVLCPDGRCVTSNTECADTINTSTTTALKINVSETCVLPSLEHGNVLEVSSSASAKVINFVCDPGFTLVGVANTSCVDGVWQELIPECRKFHPGLCEVKKLPQFLYQCSEGNGEYSRCDKYVANGSNVRVTRLCNNAMTVVPVSVEIGCNNGVFNISLECMKEIKILQTEFLHLTTVAMTNFNKIDQADHQFQESVKSFHHFEHEVKQKLMQVHRKIGECNIYFDLLLASINQSHQETSPAKNNTCDLPAKPQNGTYSIETLPNENPSEPVDFALRYVCDSGFALTGTATPRCINGVWQNKFPNCSVTCKLPKNPGLVYQCVKEDGDDDCGQYVPVGSSVRVSRVDSNDTTAVAVFISCTNNQTFNISSDCVQEIQELQIDFENPMMEKLIYYESRFHEMKHSISASSEFERMVNEYRTFEKQVTANITNMHQKALECDIYLDLLLSSLAQSLRL